MTLLLLAHALWTLLHARAILAAHPLPGAPAFLHPAVLLAGFGLLAAADLAVLDADLAREGFVVFARGAIVRPEAVERAALGLVLLSAGGLAGLHLGLALGPRDRPGAAGGAGAAGPDRAAMLPFLLLLPALWLVAGPVLLPLLREGGILAAAGRRSVLVGGDPVLALLALLLVPAFCLFAAARPGRRALLAGLALALASLALLGSRGGMAFVLLAALGAALRGRRLPAAGLLLLGLLLLGLLLAYTAATRLPGTGLPATPGGIAAFLFRSPEISVAEATALWLETRPVPRGPLESMLGGLLALVPRELLPWKPQGLSAALTEAADPLRWRLVRSEWTVSGPGNALYEMGPAGALLFHAGLMAGLGALARALAAGRGGGLLAALAVAVPAFGYLRGDIHNLGLRLSALALVLLALALLRALAALPRPPPRPLPHGWRAPAPPAYRGPGPAGGGGGPCASR